MNRKIFFGNLLFTIFLVLIEIQQFFKIKESNKIGGDFEILINSQDSILPAFLYSLIGWILVFLLSLLSKNSKPRFIIRSNSFILFVFAINFILTFSFGIGNVINKGSSYLSILTTIIPINYLVILLYFDKKSVKWKKNISIILYLLTDLSRLLIGAFFKLFYLVTVFSNKRQKILLIILTPLIFILSKSLLEFKISNRTNSDIKIKNELVIDIISSRISSLNSNLYILDNLKNLKFQCNCNEYDEFYKAAFLSLIPKKIFGLEYVKTFNNCLIEHRVKKNVYDSSVNSPFIGTLILIKSKFKLISYLILVILLSFFIVIISNKLFGYYSSVLIYWVFFEFIWTGNILTLTIPFYFLIICYIYYKLFYNGKNRLINNHSLS